MQQGTRNRRQETGNLKTKSFKLKPGFGLFELMVVITIIGITISVITASFLTFEKNQRLKNAANAMKNEIRLAQSKAFSGDKGPGGICSNNPADNETLVGWYANIDMAITNDPAQHFYTVKGDCSDPSEPAGWRLFGEKFIQLPKNVNVNRFLYGSNPLADTAVNIIYRPLTHDVTFWHGASSPPFDNDVNLLGPAPQQPLTIELKNIQDNRTYNVIIQTSGEVNESQ